MFWFWFSLRLLVVDGSDFFFRLLNARVIIMPLHLFTVIER